MDDKLRTLAERCHNFVLNYSTTRGVSDCDLARYIGTDYRDRPAIDREFIHLWISKRPGIAHIVDGDDWRFWPIRLAPESATRG